MKYDKNSYLTTMKEVNQQAEKLINVASIRQANFYVSGDTGINIAKNNGTGNENSVSVQSDSNYTANTLDIITKDIVCIRINHSGREIFRGEQFDSFLRQFNAVSMYYITIAESFSIDDPVNSDSDAENVSKAASALPRHYWEVMLMGNYKTDAGGLHAPSLFVPNYCYRLDSPKNEIISLEQTKTFLNQSLGSLSENLKHAEENLFFDLGISVTEVTLAPVRNYIEYYELEGVCNYVREYYIRKIDDLGLTNIYDPEGLRHYVYFPMQSIKNGLLEYRGMKVSAREAETFRNATYCEQLMNFAIHVDARGLPKRQRHGILLKVSITQTPTMNVLAKWASESLVDKAVHTNQVMNQFWYEQLNENRIASVQTSYNSVIIALPEHIEAKKETGAFIIDLITRLHNRICASYHYLEHFDNVEEQLDIRCTVICCDYRYGKDYINFPVRINPADIQELDDLHRITYSSELSRKRYDNNEPYGIWFGIKNEDRKLGFGYQLEQEDLAFLREPEKYESKILRERKNQILQSNMTFYFKRITGTQYVPDYHFPPKDPREHEDVFKEFREQINESIKMIMSPDYHEEMKKIREAEAKKPKAHIFTCDTCHYIFYAEKRPSDCPNCRANRIEPVVEIRAAFEAGEENMKRKVFPISTIREANPKEVKIYEAVQSVHAKKYTTK